MPLFIFDSEILEKLDNPRDKRVQFIHQEILAIKEELEKKWGSSMIIRHGKPLEVFKSLLGEWAIARVYANRDYEPYARQRDKEVYELLQKEGIEFKAYKDQVLLEKNEVLKSDGEPYEVFTPYMRQYKEVLRAKDLQSFAERKKSDDFYSSKKLKAPSLKDLGFAAEDFDYPDRKIDRDLIASYDKTRDIPGKKGTSRLSLHLRFGTISIRELARQGRELNETYFNELIWRDFYQMILYHFPHTLAENFKSKYDRLNWRNNESEFKRWCEGKTGFPLVDAGMRELNTTGFMHNRVRMLVASFLSKHLLIDWRWGEAYFAEKLLDYEAASNIGGWQWAAGCGVDAAPYFRIFNPELQLKKFDPELEYVKEYVPEYGSDDYPGPMVNHKEARERALAAYKKALN